LCGVEISSFGDLDADGRDIGIGERAGSLHGSAKDLGEAPILTVEVVGGEACKLGMVWLGGIANELVAGGRSRDGVI
jgi:hypothetical protein